MKIYKRKVITNLQKAHAEENGLSQRDGFGCREGVVLGLTIDLEVSNSTRVIHLIRLCSRLCGN